jgi:hypothetical protein
MMQQLAVILIVMCAAWTVARRYAPAPVRRAVRGWTVRAAKRLGWTAIAARMEAKAAPAASCGSGCGACGSCGGEIPAAGPAEFTIDPAQLKRTAPR